MCRAEKGDLVMILDEKKQQFVYNAFAVRKTVWIGLKRDDKYANTYIYSFIAFTELASILQKS